jgi:hypothetical protein
MEEELEIERNYILNEHNNSNDDTVIEANIIRELSELHRMEENENSKRSNVEPKNSRSNPEELMLGNRGSSQKPPKQQYAESQEGLYPYP